MTRTLAVLVALAMSLVLGGCVDFAPAYKEELLTFDEGLVGSWGGESVDDKGQKVSWFPVRIERREAFVTGGRLGEFNPTSGASDTAPKKPAPAYLITVTIGPDNKGVTRERRYDAVLLRVSGASLMAYQLSREEPALKDTFGEVLPVHKVVWVQRTGDEVRVRDMKHPVVWMPAVRTLYPESGEARLPSGDKGMSLVTDADRFVEVLKLAVGTPEEWEEGLSLKRE